MADDELRQVYGLPGVAGVRQGYVFARNRQQKKQQKKQQPAPEESASKSPEEPEAPEHKGVDIRV